MELSLGSLLIATVIGLVYEKIKHSQTSKNRDFWKMRCKEILKNEPVAFNYNKED